MKGKQVVLAGLMLLVGTSPAPAQIFGTGITPVIESGPALGQHIITAANSVITATNVAASYIRQGLQIQNEYNIILQQIAQYETMVKNLQRLPEGLNFVDTVLAYGNKLTGLLSQVNGLSYDLEDATQQFEALYLDAETVALGDLRPVKERFYRYRMGASQMAVQVQSIRSNMSELFGRLCRLLDGSWRIQGNLDAQQIAHQQQALTMQQQEQLAAIHVTAARIAAMREAEEIALARLKQRVQDEFVRALPAYTGEQGTLPSWQWVTTTSQGD
jgi:P-type conjugative transfer protein TrbJ